MKKLLRFTTAAALVAALMVPAGAFAQPAPSTLPTIDYSGSYEFSVVAEQRVFELVNDLRAHPENYTLNSGTKVSAQYAAAEELSASQVIQSVARYKSLYMLAYDDFSHVYSKGPLAGVGDGGAEEVMFFDAAYWGENIGYRYGYGSETAENIGEALFNDWMNSPTHLQFMMDPGFSHIGIGVVIRADSSGYFAYGTKQFNSFNSTGYTHSLPDPLTTGGTGASPSPAQTQLPTAEPTAIPTPLPSADPIPIPTYVPTAEPTYVPTPLPTETQYPTYSPTPIPPQTPEPTIYPTATPDSGSGSSEWVWENNCWQYRPYGYYPHKWMRRANSWFNAVTYGNRDNYWQRMDNSWNYYRNYGRMATDWLWPRFWW